MRRLFGNFHNGVIASAFLYDEIGRLAGTGQPPLHGA
jgi:hypothetical protein